MYVLLSAEWALAGVSLGPSYRQQATEGHGTCEGEEIDIVCACM